MTEQNVAEQAKVLADNDNFVTLEDGTKVEVKKCSVKQIGPVLEVVGELLKDLGILDINDEAALMAMEEKTKDPSFLLQLIAKHTDNIPKIGGALTSLDEETFGELSLDDAFTALIKVWEVNQTFFLKKILPMLGINAGASPTPAAGSKRKSRGTRSRKAS